MNLYRIVFRPVSFVLLGLFLLPFGLMAQEEDEKPGYVFDKVLQVDATPVKDQQRTGTCWSFATSSFIESELIRKGKEACDLSEMYFVRHVYIDKAIDYVRYHGNLNFGQGSLSHNLVEMLDRHGAVPQGAYPGYIDGMEKYKHGELHAVAKSYADAVLEKKDGKISEAWLDGYKATIDAYLGTPPEKFEYNGEAYTPQTFADEVLEVEKEDYIELTSYDHHPFYEQFILEIPDNFTHASYYNVPIDEYQQVIDHALENGYTVAWDGDVSETGFRPSQGIAILPEKEWDDMDKEEKKAAFDQPVPQREVTQKLRQHTFDNQTTTDDHLMHVTGKARDQEGNLYYIVKNSWGTNLGDIESGYVYMSESYLRLKTVGVMVHKDAIPKKLAQKLDL